MSASGTGALAGKTAVVTGASRGIGAGIARSLSKNGARVVLVARTEKTISDYAKQLGNESIAITADLANPDDVQRAAKEIQKELGSGPDILVNNAGIFEPAPVESMDVLTFQRTIRTNLAAPFLFMHAFIPEMKRKGSGHIVSIGSVGDRTVFPGNAAYSAAKFGLRAVHEALRAELKGSGVRCSLISPSAVDTSLWDKIVAGENADDFPKRSEMLPMQAVAAAVVFALTQPPEVNVDELRLGRA